MAAVPDASAIRFRLPEGAEADSLGRVKLSKEVVVSLYCEQGMTQREVAAATGWSTPTVMKRLKALGLEARRHGRRSADPEGMAEVPVEESPTGQGQQREITITAPDGTPVLLNSGAEVAVFKAVVDLYMASYADWTEPPDKQMIGNLARLQVGIHRHEEAFRKDGDPAHHKHIADLMTTMAGFHDKLGISRPKREASRVKEGADAWLSRIMEAVHRYDEGQLPEAIP